MFLLLYHALTPEYKLLSPYQPVRSLRLSERKQLARESPAFCINKPFQVIVEDVFYKNVFVTFFFKNFILNLDFILNYWVIPVAVYLVCFNQQLLSSWKINCSSSNGHMSIGSQIQEALDVLVASGLKNETNTEVS